MAGAGGGKTQMRENSSGGNGTGGDSSFHPWIDILSLALLLATHRTQYLLFVLTYVAKELFPSVMFLKTCN